MDQLRTLKTLDQKFNFIIKCLSDLNNRINIIEGQIMHLEEKVIQFEYIPYEPPKKLSIYSTYKNEDIKETGF